MISSDCGALAMENARRFLEIRSEFGAFDRYLWRFTDGKTLRPKRRVKTVEELPCQSDESRALSRDLAQRGFRFVGPTICYAFMQATGMVNDHTVDCFRHQEMMRDQSG